MQYRTYPRTGWQVSEIGYGMWGMGGWSGSVDRDSLEALDEAVRRGCNFFDTAWAYGQGHSERLLGELLRRHGGTRLYAATKIPPNNFSWPARASYALDDVFPAVGTIVTCSGTPVARPGDQHLVMVGGFHRVS